MSFDFSSELYRQIISADNMLSSRKVFSLLRTANRKEGKGKSVQATAARAARKNTATKSLKNSIIIYYSTAQSLEKPAGR